MPHTGFIVKFINALRPLAGQRKLVVFALKSQPVLIISSILIFTGSIFEIIGLSSLQPVLMNIQSHSPSASGAWHRALEMANLRANNTNLLIIFCLAFLMRTVAILVGHSAMVHGLKSLQKMISCTIFRNILQNIETNEIEKQKIGFFVSLAGDEAARAPQIVQLILTSIQALALAVMYSAALVLISPSLFFTIALIGLGSMVIVVFSQKRSVALGERSLELSKNAGTIFLDGVTGFKSLRSLHGTEYAALKYSREMGSYMRILRNIEIYGNIVKLSPLMVIFVSILIAVKLTPPAKLDVFLSEQGAEIILVTALLMRVLPAIGQVISCGSKAAAEAKSSRNVLEWMTGKNSATPYPDHKTQFPNDISYIEFKNVSFRYDARGPWILKDFTRRFECGRTYAIMGKSGAGKSTLLDLLAGLRNPDKGTIAIFRKGSTKPISPYRSEVVIVQQNTFLVTASIGENLALSEHYEDNPAQQTRLQQALYLSLLSEFLETLKDGVGTLLGYHGNGLSGGQKQRLAVGRAFYQDRPIIIGDEITSAFDSDTSRKLIQNLKNFCKEKILILVTHDESLLSQFDDVIRL